MRINILNYALMSMLLQDNKPNYKLTNERNKKRI